MRTLKELFNLKPDTSDYGSSLIKWYNNLINKTLEELDVADVSKMIRQDIMIDVAVDKSIDLIISNPYEGEFESGDLIKTIISIKDRSLLFRRADDILKVIARIKSEFESDQWDCDTEKEDYIVNLVVLENLCKTYRKNNSIQLLD